VSPSPALESREIRVFLSSTFRDMEAERNHLIKHVFPKVRAACLARQVGFTEIDLRWGVTEEESRNGVTVDICLKEIDRCRDFPPFFIGFLGERYGWIPCHNDLAAYWEKHPDSPYAQAIQHAVGRGISVTELEMELAVLTEGAAAKLHGQALFLLRDPALTDALYHEATGKGPDPNDTAYYDPAAGRLAALKDRIRATPYLGLDPYTRIEDFGQAIEDYLLGQLNQFYPADATPTPHQRTQAAHGAFRYHRLNNFLPRDDVRGQLVAAIHRRIEQPSLGPILLAGPSGQGKSALMADLARHLESTRTTDPIRWIVIDHYIGADEHNNLNAWIERLLNILHPDIADLVGDIPENPDEQRDALSTWLAYTARRTEQKETPAVQSPRPVRFVLLLDALDQLSDGGKNLELLKPEILGPDAILVASAADGTAARESAGTYESIIVPPLTVELTTRMIQDSLARYRKSLAPELAGRLAAAPQSGSPLFLTLALEELRLDARHESLAPLLDAILACGDAKQLFLERYLRDEDYSRNQQPDLACRFMALIGAARAGLTEQELADLLALPGDPVAADSGKPRLPQVNLSLLMTSFQPYLLDKGGRRAPMHRILAEAGLEALGETVIREQLYGYFSPGYGKDGTDVEPRAAAEALYQVTRRARADKAQRARLEDDLANLSVPATLHNVAEEVVIEALNEFTYEEKSALAERWGAQVAPLAEKDIEGIGEAIGYYAGWLYEKIGHYPAARALLEPLLEARRRILGEDHPDTLSAMNNLGATLSEQGDLPSAWALQEKVLEANRRSLGEEHPDTLLNMGNLAMTRRAQGDRPGAQALLETVLEASRRILGDDHPHTLTAMNHLALTLIDQGDLSGARALQAPVLEVRRRILGNDHPDTLTALNNLALSLYCQGDLPGARVMFEEVLDASRRILGESHRHTLVTMGNLAATLGDQGDWPGARAMQEQVLEAFRRMHGAEHPDTLWAMNNLSIELHNHGDLPGSRALKEQVLEVRRRIFGSEHPDTLVIMGHLAGTLSAQGDLPGAQAMREQVLEARRRVLGEEHPDTLSAMSNLASTLSAQGDLLGARELQEQVLEARHRILGEEHPDTLWAMDNLANTLANQGDIDGMSNMQRKQLEILERTVGPDDEVTMRVLQNYAVSLRNAGWLAEAEPLQREALARFVRVRGPDSLEAASALSAMGVLFKLKGNLKAAEEHQRRALAIRERELGPEDDATQLVRQRLEELLAGDAQ
jgi:tetratricopeptide (TPR) repeat protein